MLTDQIPVLRKQNVSQKVYVYSSLLILRYMASQQSILADYKFKYLTGADLGLTETMTTDVYRPLAS